MAIIYLFVTLKIPDNTARSALYTIQNRLGCAEVVSLCRSEFWRFDMPNFPVERAQQHVERWVRQSAFFANPNKHRWLIACADSPAMPPASPFESDVSILVSDRIDGKAESTRQALQAWLPGPEVPQALARGVWWDFYLKNASENAAQTAERLAVTKSRTHGLFANPHYQTAQIIYPQ